MAMEGLQDWTIKLLTALALLIFDTWYGYQSYWSTNLAILTIANKKN